MPADDMESPESLEKPKRFQISLGCAIFLTIAAGLLLGLAVVVISTLNKANESELNLISLNATLIVMDQYVRERPGQWPKSWDSLIATRIPNSSWPADAIVIKRRIQIDFAARLEDMAAQSIETFNAVRPIGPNDFRYSAEPTIRTLLDSIRESVKASAETKGSQNN